MLSNANRFRRGTAKCKAPSGQSICPLILYIPMTGNSEEGASSVLPRLFSAFLFCPTNLEDIPAKYTALIVPWLLARMVMLRLGLGSGPSTLSVSPVLPPAIHWWILGDNKTGIQCRYPKNCHNDFADHPPSDTEGYCVIPASLPLYSSWKVHSKGSREVGNGECPEFPKY